MADIITLASNVSVDSGGGAVVLQSLLEGMLDVSAYDTFDLQVAVLSLTTPGGTLDGVKVSILTSMTQSKTDDNSWAVLGGTDLIKSAPAWETLAITGPGVLRCLRWRVVFDGDASACTFSITGMARRKSL